MNEILIFILIMFIALLGFIIIFDAQVEHGNEFVKYCDDKYGKDNYTVNQTSDFGYVFECRMIQ